MNKAFLSFISLLVVTLPLLGQVDAQESSGNESKKDLEPFMVSTYPFSFVGSSLAMGFEHRIGDKSALKVIPAYALSESNSFYNVNELEEVYVEAQYRFYLGDQVLDGVFTGPYLLYKNMSFKSTSVTTNKIGNTGNPELKSFSTSAINLGYFIGYQLVTNFHMSLELYVGGGMMSPNGAYKQLPDNTFNVYKKGVVPHLGFSIGVNL